MKTAVRKCLVLALVIATLLLVAGCGQKDTEKGQLNAMLTSDPLSLDTAHVTDLASFEILTDCLDGLLQLDAEGHPVPAIAERYEVSADQKTYTFHLRDAKWANGDPVTAHDFIFAWRRVCKEADEYAYLFGSTVACIKNADAVIKGADPSLLGVSAPDDKTLVVELTMPVVYFPSLMCLPLFYPINENFFAQLPNGHYGTGPESFLSNGAFQLVSYTPGVANIQLKKNDTYWDADNIELSKLHYQVVGSSDNAFVAFKNGTLGLVQIRGSQVPRVKEDPALSKYLNIVPTGRLNYLSFNQDPKNHHGGALTNVNLRLAIAHAINRDSLVDNYVMDGARSTYTAVPLQFAPHARTGQFFAEDQQTFADLVGFDKKKARDCMEKAKAELGKDSFSLRMIYANDSGDATVKIVQAIKSQVEETLPEVTVELQPVPKAEYFSDISSNNYDMAMMTWVPDFEDPMSFLTLWTTSSCEEGEHWSNQEFDKIIEDCASGALAADYDARWEAMHQAERILLENAVIAPLYTNVNAMLIGDGINGIVFHKTGAERTFKSVRLEAGK